jgi:hypothetical protein
MVKKESRNAVGKEYVLDEVWILGISFERYSENSGGLFSEYT